MINDGFHREALIWIGSVRTICQQIILQDAVEEEQKKYTESDNELLTKLGFHSIVDFQKRAEGCSQLLVQVLKVGDRMLVTNPNIIQ